MRVERLNKPKNLQTKTFFGGVMPAEGLAVAKLRIAQRSASDVLLLDRLEACRRLNRSV